MNTLDKIISESINIEIKKMVNEAKAIKIYHVNWGHVDFANGKRVLECTDKSIIISSDDCTIRFSAIKRYERPDNMNPSTGFYQKYWKFIGWEINAMKYRDGKWEKYDNRFPFILKSKEEVLKYIQKAKSFDLAKKELNI